MSRLLNPDEVPKFQQLIDRYTPDPDVLSVFKKSNFAVIAGPSGAGKDTLRDGLIAKHPKIYQPVLSTTTRPMREGEQDGVDYHFRSIEQIEDSLHAREFFQAELVHNQQVSCLHIDEITKLKDEQVGLSILVVQTETKLSSIKKDIKTVFVVPPSFEVLHERLGSGTILSEGEVARRMEASKFEMLTALERQDYYCVLNHKVDEIVELAHQFLIHDKRILEHDKEARTAILNMLSI